MSVNATTTFTNPIAITDTNAANNGDATEYRPKFG